MGSMFKQGIFDPKIHEFLQSWAKDASSGRGLFSSNRIEMQNMSPELREIISAAEETTTSVEGLTGASVQLEIGSLYA